MPTTEHHPTTPPTHTHECNAAHDATETPHGEDCPHSDCWTIPDTNPRGSGIVTTIVEHDPWGTYIRTPFGPISYHDAVDDEPDHIQLDGRGTHTLADAWELHEALTTLLSTVDPHRLGRSDLAARQGHPPAPTAPAAGRGSTTDVATRLTATTARTLRRVADGELVRNTYRCLVWRDSGRMVDVEVLYQLEELRRHGLVHGITATDHGRLVAAHLEQGAASGRAA